MIGICGVLGLDGVEPKTEGVNDPLGVVAAVFDASHQGVAQQIVHTIGVQLAGDDVAQEVNRKGSVYDGPDLVGIDFVGFEYFGNPGCGVSDHECRPLLMIGRGFERSFNHVGERTVTSVVEEGCCLDGFGVLLNQA